MGTPDTPDTSPTQLAQSMLDALLRKLEQTQNALLDAATGGDPDPFVGQCADLAEALRQFSAVCTQLNDDEARALGEVWKLGGVRLQAGLDALGSQAARLSAQHQRALDQLFPPDHLKAYSRLGGRTGLAGSAYLKA